MRFLSLDIGRRHTGVAYYDDTTGIILPLSTMKHDSVEGLVQSIITLCNERSIDTLIIGLPLLPSGKEGQQSAYVRSLAHNLSGGRWTIQFIDERYTSGAKADSDARAAHSLLQTYLDRLSPKEENGI